MGAHNLPQSSNIRFELLIRLIRLLFKCLPQIIIEDNLCLGDTLLFGKNFIWVKKTKHAKAATFQHNYTKCILPEKDFNYKVFTRNSKKFKMFTFSGSFIFSHERTRIERRRKTSSQFWLFKVAFFLDGNCGHLV